ncbi:MliC family protein [Tardiphaga sp. 20_F10_N6_6]|uniref:MliC family protein n=1 Tax=Tardiphaga sp. 20_F10_N6_6 TaxID=3240788 RepID=UPI003F89EF1B
MLSRRGQTITRTAATAASLAVAALAPFSAEANPATVDYICTPALPGGNKISVDYNSGGKSITLFYPNSEMLRMPIQRSGSGFRYGEGNVEISGKGQTTITLQVAGLPARQCVTPR